MAGLLAALREYEKEFKIVTDYDVLRVGEKRAAWSLGYDACFASVAPGGALTVFVLIDRPTAGMIEKGDIEHYGIRLGAFVCDNVLTFAIKPGLLPWHDAPYNPHCDGISNLPSCRKLTKGDGLLCNYILLDSHDGQVLKIKQFCMSNDFSNYILKEQYRLSRAAFDLQAYYYSVQRIQRRYSPREIGETMKQAYYEHRPREECTGKG